MRDTILRWSIPFAAAWCATSFAATAEYAVVVDAGRPRVATVTARLEPGAHGLCMNRSAADTGLTHGWATFVHELSVTGENGVVLPTLYDGAGCWRVGAMGLVTVHYGVLLQHDRFPNEPGDDELAYAGDWGQFWTGRALFLEGAPSTDVRVSFQLPESWRVTAPWPAEEATNSFRPADLDALLDNGFMLGRHAVLALDGTGARVQIGLAGSGPEARADDVSRILRSALDAFAALNAAPADGQLAVFLGQGRLLGGGVVGSTISMLVEDQVPDELMPTLAYIITHEAFHLWNADIEYADKADFYWFIEGFAEYYTFRQMRETGRWDDAMFKSQLAERVALYREALGSLSMREAGREKLDHYDLIYSGGLMAAVGLDSLIAVDSGARYRLDDVLPLLMQRHRRGAGHALTFESLIACIRDATGVETESFFSRFVTGNLPLPDTP